MGSECSHEKYEILREDPTVYNDKSGIWKFKVCDARCNECKKNLFMEKKICVDHGIEQKWEVSDKLVCKHDVLTIKNKKKEQNKNTLTGRAECVVCRVSIPVVSLAILKKENINEKQPQEVMEWVTDKIKMREEINAQQKS